MALAAVIGAVTSVVQGAIGFSQSRYQAAVAKSNAAVAEENARRAFERGQAEALDKDRETGAFIGEQTAIQSASGLSLSSKSAMKVRRSAQIIGKLDALRVMQEADVERYNYQVQAGNFRAEAKAAKAQGIGSLLGAGLNAASGFIKPKSTFVGDAYPTALNRRFIPRPVSKPYSRRTTLGSLTYGGPR